MRLARSDRSSTLLSPRPARFPRRDSTPHAAQHSCAPLHSDAVFVLTGLVKRRRKRIREPCYSAAVNTILQLRAIFFLCCSLCFPFFLLFFFLRERVSASSLSPFRSIPRWTGRWKGGEREREACETNEQQPLRGSCYPRSIGVYSPGVLPPNPVYLPEIYIYICYIFAGVSPLFFTVRWKKRYEQFAPCIFPLFQQKRKEFSFTYVGTASSMSYSRRKHDGGVE